jgi:hypothetical protein
MNVRKRLGLALPLLVIAILVALPAAGVSAAPLPVEGVRLTRIGAPTWQPIDLHLFSASIGTAGSGYAEFGETALAILPPPNHVSNPSLLVGPGAPHQPPYDSEMAQGIAARGFHEGVQFKTSEFSNGMGVWLTWMTVPAPGMTGSSPDFDSGPMIPNSLFPIHVEGVTLRNGRMFNPWVAWFDVPALNQIDPPFMVDGSSHFPVYIADNADFGPPGAKLPGSYVFRIQITDATGNGWQVEAHFAVGK